MAYQYPMNDLFIVQEPTNASDINYMPMISEKSSARTKKIKYKKHTRKGRKIINQRNKMKIKKSDLKKVVASSSNPPNPSDVKNNPRSPRI